MEYRVPYETIDCITSSVAPFYFERGVFFILLGQSVNSSKPFAVAWGLIGGFLDPDGKSLEQCAAREPKE
jgi:ADP-ribose pyrophosphatase YjhB (NUDIX family)